MDDMLPPKYQLLLRPCSAVAEEHTGLWLVTLVTWILASDWLVAAEPGETGETETRPEPAASLTTHPAQDEGEYT